MLGCQACLKRCLQTIIGDSASCAASFRTPSASHGRSTSRRTLQIHAHSSASQSRDLEPPRTSSTTAVARLVGSSSPRKNRRQEWLESRGVRPANKERKKSSDSDFVIRKHLQYLKDPLKLAEHVKRLLRGGNFDDTLAIVRAASKDVQCTVSWNHLIDWQLSRGKMNAAIKTYNEMKKRAQVPDAYTYTIIFRGCAEHRDSAEALTKVMSVYQGMLRDKSPVKPSVIHMNALLKMCARAGNMDALFAIANDLPDGGIRAANNLTYTTIINALRVQAMTEPEGGRSPMEQRTERRAAITRARLIWQDVVKRWRKGDIWIDEELVSTMGRMLLLGNADDIDDIFSLIEQSMNVPRQLARMDLSPRASREPTIQASEGSGISQNDVQVALDTTPANIDPMPNTTELVAETTDINMFTAITPVKTPANVIIAYAKPGQNSLSLVLQALLNLHQKRPVAKSPAVNYWEIFTKKSGVVPDGENHTAYLRILRLFRASTETVKLLLQMPKAYLVHKVFRIAMSTCLRDKLNKHAFSNAGKILDLMQTHLDVPDMRALVTYLEVAVNSAAHGDKKASNEDASYSKYAQGQQIVRALERLGPSFVNVRSFLAYGDPTKPKMDRQRNSVEFLEGVLGLTQHMIRATDILMNQALVPREMYVYLTKQRSKLTALVTKYKRGELGRDSGPAPSGEDDDIFDLRNERWKVPISRNIAQERHFQGGAKALNIPVAKESQEGLADDIRSHIMAGEAKKERGLAGVISRHVLDDSENNSWRNIRRGNHSPATV